MKRSRPLPDTHPEYTLLQFPGHYEFRVENWHLSRDGSGTMIQGAKGLSLPDAFLVLALAIFWPTIVAATAAVKAVVGVLAIFLLWMKCRQVLFESVVVIPLQGIQLETHRGLPPFILSSTRRFIPFKALQDVAINEGLRRWDVRYYLVVIKERGPKDFALDVAYESLLPQYPVLHHVYNSIQDLLDTCTNESNIAGKLVPNQ